jgi:hypothetical protein
MVEMRHAYEFLVGKSEGKTPRRQEDNIRMGKLWTGFIWLRIRISGGLL